MVPKPRVRFAQYADRRLLYTRRVALSARTAARRAADKVMFIFSVYSLPQADTALYNADTANQTILVVWFAVSVFFILVSLAPSGVYTKSITFTCSFILHYRFYSLDLQYGTRKDCFYRIRLPWQTTV